LHHSIPVRKDVEDYRKSRILLRFSGEHIPVLRIERQRMSCPGNRAVDAPYMASGTLPMSKQTIGTNSAGESVNWMGFTAKCAIA